MAEVKDTFRDDRHEKGIAHPEAQRTDSGDMISASAKIQNVLHGQPKEQVIAEADAFCDKYGLQADSEIFRKGALLAQKPHDYQFIDELSQDDKEAVAYEHSHKWAYPKMLYFSVLMCAIGAATQGWDQTGSNGANLSFPTEFGIATAVGEPGGEADEWKVGAINGAPYIGAALIGCWVSDPLNNWFGRRGEIFITSIILILTPIGSAFSQNWYQLFAIRLVLGIGMGAKAATVPMYAAELSPAVVRGALVMGWQLWTAFGIFIGTCANAVVKDVPVIAWRLQLGSAFIPALPLAIGIYFCPESPRWYMKKDRLAEAWTSMKKLRSTELQAARDLYYAHVQFAEELKIVQGVNYFTRFSELFTIPRCRRATLAAGVVMIAQQMCGINIMAFYSSTIFVESGFNTDQALYASIGFGALNFLFAIPAIFTIDTFGRRSLLLATFPNMAWTLFVAGGCLYITSETTRLALVALFVYLFTIAYSIGEGPVPFMYSAEVFPLVQREQGMSFATSWCFLWASVLGLTFPRMLRAFTPAGSFFFYGGLNCLAFVMIALWVPETKRLTLEELDQVFSIPTGVYAGHQVKKSLPWFIKRYVFFQKSAKLEPLLVEDRDVTF